MKAELHDAAPRRVRKTRRPRRSRRGLTLIEILVVVTILGLIAGIVGINLFGTMTGAQEDTARTQMHNLSQALKLYQIKFQRFPSTAEGLGLLEAPPKGPALMESVPVDPWGKNYAYVYPGTSGRRFDLKSAGPDGVMDTEDDIGL